jgi:RNA polymerase sigma factor (sigma-70 family)
MVEVQPVAAVPFEEGQLMIPTSVESKMNDFERQLAEARAGSRHALGALLKYYEAALLETACYELPFELFPLYSPSDAAQTATLAVIQHFIEFDGNSEDDFGAWLREIVRNTVRGCVRHAYRKKRDRRREVSLSSDRLNETEWLADVSSPSAAEETIRRETSALVQLCLAELPEAYRRVIEFRQMGSHSWREVGLKLGISAEAARKHHERARILLAELLQLKQVDAALKRAG